ncbi:MAG TPA: TlpA family protein disulfide reductase [Stellaceae bacterium]|nr:TlpA family protein disulfide reductase [Stellaceae bacterium]
MKRALALLMLLVSGTALAATPQPLGRGDWDALLKAHRGQATIVHFWGLTCGPCLAELPAWHDFALQRRDIALVLVDADPVTVAPEDLAAMLDKSGLGKAESWRFADGFTERLEYEIDPAWHGELPYTLFIKPDGTVERQLGAVDFGALRHWSEN